jgi:hypothetical protein
MKRIISFVTVIWFCSTLFLSVEAEQRMKQGAPPTTEQQVVVKGVLVNLAGEPVSGIKIEVCVDNLGKPTSMSAPGGGPPAAVVIGDLGATTAMDGTFSVTFLRQGSDKLSGAGWLGGTDKFRLCLVPDQFAEHVKWVGRALTVAELLKAKKPIDLGKVMLQNQ